MLWFEWRYMGAGPSTFASDKLWHRLREGGIRGWGVHHNYSDHVDEV